MEQPFEADISSDDEFDTDELSSLTGFSHFSSF